MKRTNLNKERLELRVFASLIIFAFLALFLFIDKVPYQIIFKLYFFFTEDWVELALFLMMPMMLYFSFRENNFGYVLVLSSFIVCQLLFVHVFGDKYVLPGEQVKAKVESLKNREMHFPNWNFG